MHRTINVKSPNNTSKWQMGFNSAFKGLTANLSYYLGTMLQCAVNTPHTIHTSIDSYRQTVVGFVLWPFYFRYIILFINWIGNQLYPVLSHKLRNKFEWISRIWKWRHMTFCVLNTFGQKNQKATCSHLVHPCVFTTRPMWNKLGMVKPPTTLTISVALGSLSESCCLAD
jgi:hypothetical protein